MIAKTPSVIRRNYTEITRLHKTSGFERTLKIFLQKRGFQLGRQQEVSLPFNSVPIWTKVRLRLPDIQELDSEIEDADAFYAHPDRNRFDTVLIGISSTNNNNYGLKGMLY